MTVTVKFFAFTALAGTSESVAELPAGATVAALAGLLAEQFPALFPAAGQAIFLVNDRIGSRDTALNDKVKPASGASHQTQVQRTSSSAQWGA